MYLCCVRFLISANYVSQVSNFFARKTYEDPAGLLLLVEKHIMSKIVRFYG